jgi:hypothetical protein
MASYQSSFDGAYSQRFDYDGSGNITYKGFATPGSATSAAAWAICSFTYSGSNVVAILWASGNNAMSNVWDNRAGLAYS